MHDFILLGFTDGHRTLRRVHVQILVLGHLDPAAVLSHLHPVDVTRSEALILAAGKSVKRLLV
jgi:hypothetical protein